MVSEPRLARGLGFEPPIVLFGLFDSPHTGMWPHVREGVKEHDFFFFFDR